MVIEQVFDWRFSFRFALSGKLNIMTPKWFIYQTFAQIFVFWIAQLKFFSYLVIWSISTNKWELYSLIY